MVVRALVDKIFDRLPERKREEIANETMNRRVVLFDTEVKFAKKMKESAERKRALEISKPLGSEKWRSQKKLDDFGVT